MNEDNKNNGTVTMKKSTLWKLGTFAFLGLFVISILTGGFGLNNNSPTGAQVVNNNPSPSQPTIPTGIASVNAKELEDDDPYLGDENAPVTIIEFSDFECPFCARFHSSTLDQIKTEYVDTGKVKFVYRDFPLDSIHSQATPAAEAAQCAFEQGKFWEFHDEIFANQQSLGSSLYKQIASDLGLDTNKFNDCVDSRKYREEVKKDLQDGASVGIRGTPGFIVNSVPLSGAQPFSSFQAVIEAELAK